jgi:hypothetical protein
LRDLVSYDIRPAQYRVDSVAQRAKLSPVHRLPPRQDARFTRYARTTPFVKFVHFLVVGGGQVGEGVQRTETCLKDLNEPAR